MVSPPAAMGDLRHGASGKAPLRVIAFLEAFRRVNEARFGTYATWIQNRMPNQGHQGYQGHLHALRAARFGVSYLL